METYLPVPAASKTLAWFFTRLPDENSAGHSRVYRSTANRRNGGRHGQLSPFLLGHVTCLHCPQVSSHPQAIGPVFHLTILSLLGCGLCKGVLSGVFRYLLILLYFRFILIVDTLFLTTLFVLTVCTLLCLYFLS